MATVPLAPPAPVPATPTAATSTPARTDETERVRGRLPSITVDRLLAIGAAFLFPTGLLVILLGWWGAAHSPFLFEQVPYMISGGFMGLAITMVGGLLYFGSWVLRLSVQQRETADQLRQALVELRADLAARPMPARVEPSGPATADGSDDLVTAPIPTVRGAPPVPSVPPVPSTAYVATPAGSMYHVPTCAVVQGHEALRPVLPAAAATMRPCRICLPGG